MTHNAPSLTIFFPAYNDACTISGLVATADATAKALTADYEIIVINDGSRDATSRVIEQLAAKNPRVRCVHHKRNRGYGGALRSGFAHATKEFVFYTDGDGQYDPRQLTQLFAQLKPGVDVVQGYKMKRSDPLHRRIIGHLYKHTVKHIFQLKVRDVDCDYRLIRRSLLSPATLQFNSGAICVQLIRSLQDAGAQIVERPVSHYPRRAGRSQFFRLRPVLQTARDLALLRWKLRHAT